MDVIDNLKICGNTHKADGFVDSLQSGKFLFSMVMSYTATCEIPGISIAGADTDSFKFTPPADAEYLHYGYCKTIDGIPITPDGKPTPALLTKAALEHSSIPHMIINAGSRITPQLPFIETGLMHGNNISHNSAMSVSQVMRAVDYGRIVGRNLSSLADCIVIGESIPGGTTTAMAVLHGLGFQVRVSSSMPDSPIQLKENIVHDALSRIATTLNSKSFATKSHNNPPITDATLHMESKNSAERLQYMYAVVAQVGDPMIPFVAGMLSSASMSSKVMLAGGTQMAAVLAFASGIEFNVDNVAIGTTTYVADDSDADFTTMISQVADIPAFAVDLGLENSKYDGLKAFATGYAKEGVGAGGCIISSMIKSGMKHEHIVDMVDAEYTRLFSKSSNSH